MQKSKRTVEEIVGNAFFRKMKTRSRRVKIYCLWLVLVGSILQACDSQLPIGLDFVEKDPLHVFNLDTVTVRFSTVDLDSMATSKSGRLLAGFHRDSLLGSIQAKSYFLLSNDSLDETPDPKYSSYQSAVFRLYYDDYWYYDTTKVVTFSLYTLNDLLEGNDDTGELYNTSSFPYDSTNGFLGKLTFMPRPHSDYIEVPIDYAFGDSLFEAVMNEEDFISDDDDFYDRYKGIVLIPDKEDGPLLGFTTASSLVLKYIEGGEDKELIFNVGDELYFNQVGGSRTGSLIADLPERKYSLRSGATENMAFLRGGSGLGIRIEFPYLHNLLQLSKDVYISQAYMIISPAYSSAIKQEPYPSTFSVYAVDKLNREYEQLDITPALYLDSEYKEETYYQISLASYLNAQLSVNEDQGDALLLKLPDASLYNSVTTLAIGNSENKYKSQLKILILSLDQNEL